MPRFIHCRHAPSVGCNICRNFSWHTAAFSANNIEMDDGALLGNELDIPPQYS